MIENFLWPWGSKISQRSIYESRKSPFEQKVDQKQTMLDPNNVIVQDTPKDLPAEWIGAADIPTASE